MLFGVAPLDHFAEVVARYVAVLHGSGLPDVDAADVRRWLNGAMIHEFVNRTMGVARWAATTPRGLEILDRGVARTPRAVVAWRDLDPAVFDR